MQKLGRRREIERIIRHPVDFDARVLVRGVILAGSAFLLLTHGGAIVGAPALLPLLAWVARGSGSRGVGVAAAILAGLTSAEVAWAGVYVTIGEKSPWIVAIPVLAGGLVTVWFLRGALR